MMVSGLQNGCRRHSHTIDCRKRRPGPQNQKYSSQGEQDDTSRYLISVPTTLHFVPSTPAMLVFILCPEYVNLIPIAGPLHLLFLLSWAVLHQIFAQLPPSYGIKCHLLKEAFSPSPCLTLQPASPHLLPKLYCAPFLIGLMASETASRGCSLA